MCGIVGLITDNKSIDLEKNVLTMANKLEHRGPDDAGVWLDKKLNVAFGHRRLAVIDITTAGHQPMLSHCGRYVIVFNGEIYNHLALRDELEKTNKSKSTSLKSNQINWKGRSDTETLLECISLWGVEKTLEVLVGMFAFALWDLRDNSLILARDRFGEKPLYYGWVNDIFIFGSELKSIRSFSEFNNPINRDALALYFQYSVIPAPHSIYQEIFKLEPGHFLSLQKNRLKQKDIKIKPYWQLKNVVNSGIANLIKTESEAIKALKNTLIESVSMQSVADVPLGAFLSGGIDSSLIAALMQEQSSRPIETFTVGFDEVGFDESIYASAVAKHLGTNHHELRVTPDDARAVIPQLHQLYDEPFADSSQIPTYLICQAARQKVTVAISGDAGDELFGGYNRYLYGPNIWNKLKWMPPFLRSALGSSIQGISIEKWDSFSNLLKGRYAISSLGSKAHKIAYRFKAADSFDNFYRSIVTDWSQDVSLVIDANRLAIKLDNISQFNNHSEAAHRMMIWDIQTYLPDDILTKVDRAAMGVSLETRIPFLDHRVVELAWRLPLNMKIRDGQGKWALRQVLYKYVPSKLIERPKTGFAIPIGLWLRGPLRQWAESLLESSRLSQEGYLDVALVRQIWKEHLSGKSDWTSRLWSILMFQSWLDEQK